MSVYELVLALGPQMWFICMITSIVSALCGHNIGALGIVICMIWLVMV